MSGPGACATAVEDEGDGSYVVTWSAALSGPYRLSVLVNGSHVQGSPFQVHAEGSAHPHPGGGAVWVSPRAGLTPQAAAARSPRGGAPHACSSSAIVTRSGSVMHAHTARVAPPLHPASPLASGAGVMQIEMLSPPGGACVATPSPHLSASLRTRAESVRHWR